MWSLGVSGAALVPLVTVHRPPSHRRIPSNPAASIKPSVSYPLAAPKWKLNSAGETPIQPNPVSKRLYFVAKTLMFSSTAGLLLPQAPSLFLPVANASGGGSVGYGNGSGGGGGDGSGGGGFWSRFVNFPAATGAPKDDNDNEKCDESQEEWDSHGLPANVRVKLNQLSGFKKYKVSEIIFFDIQKHEAVSGDEDVWFFRSRSVPDVESIDHILRDGGVFTKSQLQKHLQCLARSGLFEKLDMEGKTNPDGTLALKVSFRELAWDAFDKFRCISVGGMPPTVEVDRSNMLFDEQYAVAMEREYKKRVERARPCLLPPQVYEEVVQMVRGEGKKITGRMFQKISQKIEKWYHDEGYLCARVMNYVNMHTDEPACEVLEGDITRLDVKFLDQLGNVCEANTQLPIVERNLAKQLRPDHIFNIKAAKLSLDNINALGLFSNIEFNPRDDEQNEGGVILEIKLKELEPKSAEVTTEWSIIPGPGGRPTLGSLQPGGTVSIEHRNIGGLDRSIHGSVTTSNILNPDQDNLSFQLEYVHPYMDGVDDPRDRTFRTSCFNSRKLSPVFTGGPETNDIHVPPIWVDRSGVKANITENLTKQSKFTYGLVMEEITTRDENHDITKNGQRVQLDGRKTVGPPTTLSGLGIDRMAFLQANITRNNTKNVNGALVGERNVFQVDQGIGVGSKFPLFNRHQLSLTRFIPLKRMEEGADKSPPPILVLHGHYGGCVGDLPSYDAFTLGGPYSVRGYNMGELGAARYILEFAGELRIPVKKAYIYAFAEHGNDLGSSKDVKGNPTETYRRMGQGSSYGVGAKLGQVRAEYAIDHNSGTGALFFRFGDRF